MNYGLKIWEFAPGAWQAVSRMLDETVVCPKHDTPQHRWLAEANAPDCDYRWDVTDKACVECGQTA